MRVKLAITSFFLLVLAPAGWGAALTVKGPFGGYLRKEVISLREARYGGMVPQRYDFSCGAASLATIIKFYYGLDVSEEEVIKGMVRLGNEEKIRKGGFSLLDLKRYATKRGFIANGYKIRAENLPRLKIPAIVLLEIRGYSHFVVLKGVRGERVYIADPAVGNRSFRLEDFVKGWNGIIFVLYRGAKGRPFALQTGPKAPVQRIIPLADLPVGIGVWGPLRPPGAF
ncbi:MAG: peptidase C39 [Deltaproteobacteria bacterium]|mgnify:CR=1 FL=1|nr:MAG: peptidase C39 [Deltaproteobacteria bacterium]